jgi:hypothetical protein
MSQRRAIFKVTAGPNDGDTVSVELGACRLIGRHLSENETAFIDRDGNRVLDAAASKLLTEHLKDRSPAAPSPPEGEGFSVTAFERGPDIIFSDDAISRAHAMLFFDPSGVGIIDLASTNGTYVNNERVTSTLISDGDAISLGSSELTVTFRK